MSARLLHGKPIADAVNTTTRERVAALAARGVTPKLAIVSVGVLIDWVPALLRMAEKLWTPASPPVNV